MLRDFGKVPRMTPQMLIASLQQNKTISNTLYIPPVTQPGRYIRIPETIVNKSNYMKQKLLVFLSATAVTGLLFSACKKSDSKPPDTGDTNAQAATHSDDESMMSEETTHLITDADLVIESDGTFSGNNLMLDREICDATVSINEDSDPMTMTITYTGESCDSTHSRTGTVVLSMAKNAQWKDAGTAITVNFQNVKIVRTADKKTLTLNGTQTYTNVSGGLLFQLATKNIVHSITSSNMSVTFDNGDARVWSIAKQRAYSYNSGAVLSVSGTHTEGSVGNIAEWGANRYGKTFSTATIQPLVYTQACDFRLTSGTVTHTTELYTATVKFGLDAAGAPTGCPGTGHYFYQLDFSGTNGAHLSIVLPY